MKFEVVILGSDINAYYMGRSYYEKYHKKAYLLAKEKMNFTSTSKLFNIRYVGDLWDSQTFIDILTKFSNEFIDVPLLLIPSNDFYVRLINENQAILSQLNYYFHANDMDIIDSFLIKDEFYRRYSTSELLLPKTHIHSANQDFDVKAIENFMYPLILKPGNGVEYYKHKFENQAKVYKFENQAQLLETVKIIEDAGYNDQLIIQEFIPGDDSYLFDCIMYVDQHHKVQLASFAQIALQEHTSSGIGNLTVLVNGYSEFGNVEQEINKLKNFIESTSYTGFLEFDLKYDTRDNQYKVFEINPRQARSSYYLTALGANLVQYLVDDLIFNKQLNYRFLDEQIVLSFVPKKVIMENVFNPKLKAKILELLKANKFTDPLDAPIDFSIKRKIWLTIRKYNYVKKYRRYQW